MIKKIYCISLGVTSLFGASLQTDPFCLGVRHIESKGIGYHQGYTTLEAFFASTEAWGEDWVPFLDLRGHLFNNGRSAINSGIGVRYHASRVWGMSGYYDYRNTFHTHYNQVSLGLESLGKVWDFRLNGYLPFGKKRKFALQSFNAEVGVHIASFKKAPLYFAAGPYYLNGERKSACGFEARGSVDMYKHIRLEVSSSYDHLFKWIGQGQIGVFFFFGGKKEAKAHSCATLRQIALQQVDRKEIIPIGRKAQE